MARLSVLFAFQQAQLQCFGPNKSAAELDATYQGKGNVNLDIATQRSERQTSKKHLNMNGMTGGAYHMGAPEAGRRKQ